MKATKKRKAGKVGRPAGRVKDGVSMRIVLARDAFDLAEEYQRAHGLSSRTAAIEAMLRRPWK